MGKEDNWRPNLAYEKKMLTVNLEIARKRRNAKPCSNR